MGVGGVSRPGGADPFGDPSDSHASTPPPAANPLGPQVIRVPSRDGVNEVRLPGLFEAQPKMGAAAEEYRTRMLGPTYGMVMNPSGMPTIQDHVGAEAALPAVLLGSLAAPATKKAYNVIDKIPEVVRRPFEKNLGVMIDTALSASSVAVSPLLATSVKGFHKDGSNLPKSADLQMQAYGQISMSCGETAVATILKAAGEPVSLGGIDTQTPLAGGGSSLVAQELKRRGLSLVNGQGDAVQLKAMVAAGFPVMVNIKRETTGAMHYAVVTGYDENTKTYTINNYAKGEKNVIPQAQFEKEWGGTKNHMTVVVPRKDARLEPLLKMNDPKRPDKIYEGLTLSDFFVTQAGKVFVEGAYRYVTKSTDVTVRVNYNSRETELDRAIGGALSIKHRLPDGWHVGLDVEKMSLKGQNESWSSFDTAPISVYGEVGRKGFTVRAGGERGAVQASVAADLGDAMANLGFRANVSVDRDGSYRVFGGISGTF